MSESLALIKEVLQSVGDDRHRRLFGGS
ncbi:MAG: hypothetical protein ACI89D_002219, partial [Bermanella sp.]